MQLRPSPRRAGATSSSRLRPINANTASSRFVSSFPLGPWRSGCASWRAASWRVASVAPLPGVLPSWRASWRPPGVPPPGVPWRAAWRAASGALPPGVLPPGRAAPQLPWRAVGFPGVGFRRLASCPPQPVVASPALGVLSRCFGAGGLLPHGFPTRRLSTGSVLSLCFLSLCLLLPARQPVVVPPGARLLRATLGARSLLPRGFLVGASLPAQLVAALCARSASRRSAVSGAGPPRPHAQRRRRPHRDRDSTPQAPPRRRRWARTGCRDTGTGSPGRPRLGHHGFCGWYGTGTATGGAGVALAGRSHCNWHRRPVSIGAGLRRRRAATGAGGGIMAAPPASHRAPSVQPWPAPGGVCVTGGGRSRARSHGASIAARSAPPAGWRPGAA